MTPGIDDPDISKEKKEKAIKEFEEKMSHSPIKIEAHPKLFTKKTWTGIEIDWTRILEFSIFAVVMVLVFGIPNCTGLYFDRTILSNQDIIKQNQIIIINNQHEKIKMQAECLKIMQHYEHQQNVMLALLTVRMGEPCNRCHVENIKHGSTLKHSN